MEIFPDLGGDPGGGGGGGGGGTERRELDLCDRTDEDLHRLIDFLSIVYIDGEFIGDAISSIAWRTKLSIETSAVLSSSSISLRLDASDEEESNGSFSKLL